ncbi:MAG TPA: endonuclease/exonuclease/phosphatase family protein [Thermoanaerobaculia bacterium]|jgi:endonuclease/exonuclease/phosphatase family metal-dependent hydrolase|nr:endonuclease/exonuclease/phosphatase family protein [Thermoanaerobaculia bacterium]
MPRLRLMTYNVRACTAFGCGGEVDRVAAAIGAAEPDVVALQEVEAGVARSGFRDQTEELAAKLGWQSHFQPAMKGDGGGAFGNALLSRLPLRLVGSGLLPQLLVGVVREPRGISWHAVQVDGREMQVLVTHLGLTRRERLAQIEALLGPLWMGDPRCAAPRLLCGDLNCRPGSPEHRRLEESLVDAVLVSPPAAGSATFPALRPLVRLDHVLVSPDVRVHRTEVPRRRELRRASDHLPLVVDLEVP